MMKAIFKNGIKDIPYAKVANNILSAVPYNNNIKFHNGTSVTLAAVTKDGLRIICSRIGNVIKVSNNTIKIKFDKDLAVDDKLYALINSNNFKTATELIVAYKEA